VRAFLAPLALAVACQGPILDLDPPDTRDPSCPEVAPGVDLSRVDFGRGAVADCIRFFGQTAVLVDQDAVTTELDVGLACDALANAAGATISTSPDIHDRCDAALKALGPFTHDPPVSTPCAGGPPIACGACGSCNAAASSTVRGICTPPGVKITSAASEPQKAALELYLPTLLAASDARTQTVLDALDALGTSALDVGAGAQLDARDSNCMGHANNLLLDASSRLRAARSEAIAVLAAR
jgi:hypothetical protein